MSRTASRLGQVNTAGSDTALFLKRYAGETLAAFREKTKFMSRHMVRTIDSGKSAQFPVTGKASASYHTVGDEIVGGSIPHNEKVITIDDLLISTVFVAEIDEAMNHYPTRQEYSAQAGFALAKTLDQHVAQVKVLAARSSATVTGGSGGSVLTDADADTNADSLVGSFFDAAQAMDEKDVPEEDRFAFVRPEQYYMLINSSSKAIHRDYGGSGSLADGSLPRVAGLEIVPTNNLPSTNIATGPTAYQGDFTNLVSVVSHRSAAGTVKLIDLAVEMEYQIEYQGTLIVAKIAVGHDVLRPESAVEIKTA